MLKIKSFKDKQEFKKIEMVGHTNYREEGSDIVCAAASAIIITGINGILSLNLGSIDYQEEKDLVTIKVITNDDITNKLLESMVNLLIELTKDYPDNAKYIEEEYRD